MIHNLSNKVAHDIWDTAQSKKLPRELWVRARHLLFIMAGETLMEDLLVRGQPPRLGLHKLKGDRRDEWSIRLSGSWRITFRYKNGVFYDVKIEDYH
jgi:proteic killer suppression protein